LGDQETGTAAISDGPHVIFEFTYHSIPFRVLVDPERGSEDGVLQAELGVVPFTGDGENRRSNTLAVIDAARRIPGYDVNVRPNHTIGLSMTLPKAADRSVEGILAAALESLTGAKALLDLMISFQPPHARAHLRAG
jgi:hypothetical protein